MDSTNQRAVTDTICSVKIPAFPLPLVENHYLLALQRETKGIIGKHNHPIIIKLI